MGHGFRWIKSFFILLILALLMWLLPAKPIDPWNMINLKKISTLVFALSFIQILGTFFLNRYGHKTGSIMTGFLGGLVSSTATTAALAHQSQTSKDVNTSAEVLTFLAATLAMLLEGLFVTLLGSDQFHFSLTLVFVGPVLFIFYAIHRTSEKIQNSDVEIQNTDFDILPLLKLTIFIIGVLTLSKWIQSFIGGNALLLLTFVVSLFEIHGSLIANVQLQDAGTFSVFFLATLISISIAATFISKLFLVRTLGNPDLKRNITRLTVYLFISLILSWAVFSVFEKIIFDPSVHLNLIGEDSAITKRQQ